MTALVIALAVASLLLVAVVYLLGFRLGGDHWLSELARVRAEAAQAARRLHDLTREAFVAMAEHAERRRSNP
jgi:hypothetical protein